LGSPILYSSNASRSFSVKACQLILYLLYSEQSDDEWLVATVERSKGNFVTDFAATSSHLHCYSPLKLISTGRTLMKRLLAILALATIVFTASAPIADACRRSRARNCSCARTYRPTYARTRYRRTNTTYYSYNNHRSFWQKHRDKLTTAIGAGYGAGLGALIGGRRGAAIGALTGGGAAAVYTYGIRNRHGSSRRY
jgi:hypothetical protein